MAQRPTSDQLTTSQGRRLGLPALIAAHVPEPLLQLLDSPAAAPGATGLADAAARLDAVAALGRVGGTAALGALRALAFDKKSTSEALRKAAYRAYKRAQRQADRQKKYEAQP